ncbi:MAG: hypothetical protein MI723_07675, partial [Caulobacterales bacterium]|nr:hypothetical protein [Caulobacterales bacterium]
MRARGGVAISGHAKLVLLLVVAFTTAFVAVIGIKISQDWRTEQREAQLLHLRATAYQAERARGNISRAHGAVAGAARGLEADWNGDGDADIFGHIRTLSARGDIADVALLSPDGEMRGAANAVSGALLAQALGQRGSALEWIAAGPDGAPDVYLAERLAMSGRERLLVARIEFDAVVPPVLEGQTLALISPRGRISAVRSHGLAPARGAPAARVFDLPESIFTDVTASGRSTVRSMALEDGARGAIGVTAVGRSGLTLVLQGPLELDLQGWRRTLLFYLFLLVAP